MTAIVSDTKSKGSATLNRTIQVDSSTRGALYPNQALPLTDHPPVVLLAMCLFGEARGESVNTRRAVAQVVVNRARHAHQVFGSQRGLMFHENVVRVVTQRCQFSCFLVTDVNYEKLFDPLSHDNTHVWNSCIEIASVSLASGNAQDSLTDNSDHYFDDSIQPPSWADPAKATVKFGRLQFYRLYLPVPHTSPGKAEPRGEGQLASALPSTSSTLTAASTAAAEALPTSFPAPPPPIFGDFRFGLTGWPRGWELTSLGTRGQAGGSQTMPSATGTGTGENA